MDLPIYISNKNIYYLPQFVDVHFLLEVSVNANKQNAGHREFQNEEHIVQLHS